MWIPVTPINVAYGPIIPPTGAISALANVSTNYGGPRLMETETAQNFPFGFRVQGFDPILGFGEFIYLQGVASTIAGSLVNYNPFTGVTTLNVPAAGAGLPLAVALAPTVANLFGWYQIAGSANVANNATAAAGNAFQVGTGTISSTATPGQQILGGARILTANGSTFTKVGTVRNGNTEAFFSNLDGLFVGLPISGTGIPGGTSIAAGYNNSPNGRNSSAGGYSSVIMSAAATADGTITATFTRTNFSVMGGQFYSGQGQIT
jgi:hypothetical protein